MKTEDVAWAVHLDLETDGYFEDPLRLARYLRAKLRLPCDYARRMARLVLTDRGGHYRDPRRLARLLSQGPRTGFGHLLQVPWAANDDWNPVGMAVGGSQG